MELTAEAMEAIIARDAPRMVEEEAAVAMAMVVATTTAIMATRMHVELLTTHTLTKYAHTSTYSSEGSTLQCRRQCS